MLTSRKNCYLYRNLRLIVQINFVCTVILWLTWWMKVTPLKAKLKIKHKNGGRDLHYYINMSILHLSTHTNLSFIYL